MLLTYCILHGRPSQTTLLSRSVLIGISLGVSETPCTIQPLAAALVFHQCFEGFALGGSLVDAGYQLCAPAIRSLTLADAVAHCNSARQVELDHCMRCACALDHTGYRLGHNRPRSSFSRNHGAPRQTIHTRHDNQDNDIAALTPC